MMKRILGAAILVLLSAVWAHAQTCAKTSSTTQTCTFHVAWVAPAVDSAHDAATSYVVQRKDGAATTFSDVATVTALNYNDAVAGDPGNFSRCYQVVSVNATGRDGPSTQVCKTSPAIVPSLPNPPTGLTVSAISNTAIQLTWNDNSDNELGFQAQRSGAGQTALVEFAMNAAIGVDYGLLPRTWYTYKIRALGDAGTSAWSNSTKTKTEK